LESNKSHKAKTVRISIKHYLHDIFLIYRLLAEERKREGYVFSLSITQIGGSPQKRIFKLLPDISRNRDEAIEIYKAFSRGLVPPETADEIISDMLGV